MVDVLIVNDLWFAFGSHLLNIKWAMMYALKRGYKFYYKYNTYPPLWGDYKSAYNCVNKIKKE
jgi:hypothetical protein